MRRNRMALGRAALRHYMRIVGRILRFGGYRTARVYIDHSHPALHYRQQASSQH